MDYPSSIFKTISINTHCLLIELFNTIIYDILSLYLCTPMNSTSLLVQCRNYMVSFRRNLYNTPWLLVFFCQLVYVPSRSAQRFVQYHVILDSYLTASDCTYWFDTHRYVTPRKGFSYIFRYGDAAIWRACIGNTIKMICDQFSLLYLNSSPPSDAYMRQWIGAALVQIMARRLFGAKPLSEPMLGYCQLDP